MTASGDESIDIYSRGKKMKSLVADYQFQQKTHIHSVLLHTPCLIKTKFGQKTGRTGILIKHMF